MQKALQEKEPEIEVVGGAQDVTRLSEKCRPNWIECRIQVVGLRVTVLMVLTSNG